MVTFIRFLGKGATGKLRKSSPLEVQQLRERGEKFEVILTGRSIIQPKKKVRFF